MNKIFRYECQRLLWNKFFFGFLGVLLLYGWQVLEGVTLSGISHTAPFSPWSFGDYLSRMMPLLWTGALFFLTFFTSSAARRAAVLTDAAPVSPRRYALTRCAAALTGTCLITFACLAEAAVFYRWYFGWQDWGTLILPGLTLLVPALVFSLGSSWLLGRIRPWLLYVWMLFPFLCRVLPLPQAASIWNGSFFARYPLTLDVLDPPFSLPFSIAAVQTAVLGIGVMLWGIGMCWERKG